MTAQIVPLPSRHRWPDDPDEYRIALGRALARRGEEVSNAKARELAQNFLSALAITHVVTAGMADGERKERLANMIEEALSEAESA